MGTPHPTEKKWPGGPTLLNLREGKAGDVRTDPLSGITLGLKKRPPKSPQIMGRGRGGKKRRNERKFSHFVCTQKGLGEGKEDDIDTAEGNHPFATREGGSLTEDFDKEKKFRSEKEKSAQVPPRIRREGGAEYAFKNISEGKDTRHFNVPRKGHWSRRQKEKKTLQKVPARRS